VGTIIVSTVLGLLGLVFEMLNLRKAIVAFTSIILIGLAGYSVVSYWDLNAGFYSNMIIIDNYSIAFSVLLLVITGLLVALSGEFFKREENKISDYVSLFVFTLVGALMMVSYGNMAALFIGIEILSISLYVLAASNRKSLASNEAGLKYFLMGAFATGFLLLGITLVYGVTGSFDVREITFALSSGKSSPLLLTGILMLMVAMLFKASVAPFHFWAPDVYTGSPSLVTALMSTVAKVAAFGAMFKLFSLAFRTQMPQVEPLLILFILVTLVIANFSALRQNSVKRIMAFSGVSHAGFLLLSVVTSMYSDASHLFYYATGYALASVVAFTVIIYVSHVKGNDQVASFTGLVYERPALGVALILALLSLSGIPPLTGFLGKYLVLMDAVQEGYTYVAVVAILMSIVSIYYYFKILIAVVQRPEQPGAFSCAPAIFTIVAWIGTLAIIVLGVIPNFFANLL